ncbi:DNA methyltransferase [Mycoplasma sp. M5725]|uniref:DNA methyltransferase n=1 Tax=Mycoplasma phocimorsus TaxID=3045839 RepID=A0AAJ1UWJ2_9MOLU|nr:DNA methyltransferase [Mycoplasma phocimorsus]MDJ1645510.1 DNA methyltransferase [Mycoplasma phocimorsus]
MKINLFETFAGIGSQYKALKNIEKELGINVNSLGCTEFYIDAILIYQLIHYGKLQPEKELTHNQMASLLSEFTFSSNSKEIVSSNYFARMKQDKLASIFTYLYSFVNNTYFNKVYNNRIREREKRNWHYKVRSTA